MKKRIVLFILGLIVFNAFSQTSNVPTPEFSDQPYIWFKESNELLKLSKETADYKGGLTKVYYKFDGIQSATKIPSEKNVSFLVNLSMPAMLSAVKLYKLEVKKKFRQVEIMSTGIGGKANMTDENVIEINSKKITENVYEIVVSKKLEKGDYVFIFGMNSFTFSII